MSYTYRGWTIHRAELERGWHVSDPDLGCIDQRVLYRTLADARSAVRGQIAARIEADVERRAQRARWDEDAAVWAGMDDDR